jgi:hypothetical protein
MKFISLLIIPFVSFAQSNVESNTTAKPSLETQSVLPSDFFAGALADAQLGTDELGTQRLVEVKSSELSPSLSLSSAFKYTSNPEKSSDAGKKEDGTTLDLSLMFMLGLGEYGIGDEVVTSPSIMLMHLRTYNDTIKDFGTDMRLFDVDVQIASITFPFVLPNDYTLSVANTYVRPISFRNDGDHPNHQMKGNILSYSNTPSVTLSKIIPLENGHILNLSSGLSYAISNGDTLSDSLDSALMDFLKLSDTLASLQDGMTHSVALSYIIPVNDELSLTPSFSYSKMFYKKGANSGRHDITYILGASASYTLNEAVNLTSSSNYTAKESNGVNGGSEYRDFVTGLTFALNYSF